MADNKGKGKSPPPKGGKGAPQQKGPPPSGKAMAKEAKGRQREAAGDAKLATAEELSVPKDYVPRLKKLYNDKIRAQMTERFQYKNALEVPQIEKIVINMGVGDAVSDTKKVTAAAADLAMIAGQKPVITRARKAISTFKLRENMPIGAKVTLRKTRMYEFLDRLVTIALPRIRDFRGLNPKSFDGRGNFAVGIKEHIVFPEINYDKVEAVVGMDIIVCTTAKTDEEARALLGGFDFPFRQ